MKVGTYTELAGRLTDNQRQTCEQLLAPHAGMMSMMAGDPMTSGRTMPAK